MTNPNIKYPLYENGKYVAVLTLDPNGPSFVTKDEYNKTEEKFKKLSKDTQREIERSKSAISIILSDHARTDLKNNGLGMTLDSGVHSITLKEANILFDVTHGRTGYDNAVYNVSGRPVRQEHFDQAGNLKGNVAKIYQRNIPPHLRASAPARP